MEKEYLKWVIILSGLDSVVWFFWVVNYSVWIWFILFVCELSYLINIE